MKNNKCKDYCSSTVKAIIGLGNPGQKFAMTRHNIGFLVVDELAKRFNTSWQQHGQIATATIRLLRHDLMQTILLLKPLTFMNNSGNIVPLLVKKDIKSEEIIVVHDELEKKFGSMSIKFSGSARGHNGLRSLISGIGCHYWRLRFGISRPENKAEVAHYVLSIFSLAEQQELEHLLDKACSLLLG